LAAFARISQPIHGINMQDHSSRDALTAIAMQKYAVGQPVLRKEDDTLVRGHGRYTDDISLPRQAHCVIVRSTYAHGILKSVDTAEAKTMPGVLGVWTAADLAPFNYGAYANRMPMKGRNGEDIIQTNKTALASDRVRFVGDPVAFVVAETAAQARDAAESVGVDIDPLPAVVDASEAVKPGAPQLYDNVPNNTILDFHYGDKAKCDEAFAKAAHVTKLYIDNTRIAVVAMEPRAGIGHYDAKKDHYTLHVPTQGVAGNRNLMAQLLKVDKEKVRIVTSNVGGSFGMKSVNYPEYLCILHASKQLGRPVKWTDDRSGSFLSDTQGRANDVNGELALAADGTFLGARITGYGNVGAHITGFQPSPLAGNVARNIAAVYRTPVITIDIKCVVTNTGVLGAYRGAGRPEANYFMERLIDAAAAEMKIDSVAIRRKNMIKPAQIPFASASGTTYDSGDFPAVLADALTLADHAGFAKRKRESKKRGMLRGIAVGPYLEVTGPPGGELGKITFEPDGGVTITTGTLDYGQGHATPFAQVLSERLGVPFDSIRLMQNDSDLVRVGQGTGGSKSIMSSGTAIVEAAAIVVEKAKKAAAHVLEASESDIEFARGRFTIAGTDRSIDIMDLAKRVRDGQAGDTTSLDADHATRGDMLPTYPNGCHIAEVEIDPQTGVVQVVKYAGVNDFGTVVNPMLVEGQIHGGVAQGIGQTLMENMRFDESGQPITGSLMDYALPRAGDVPMMALGDHPSPTPNNPLGAKGCGEAGCAGSMSTIVNAVINALEDYGPAVHKLNMPLTSEKIWRAIQDGKAA
jgi:aerobic carbon-monoxide dehydrogenase large subunit